MNKRAEKGIFQCEPISNNELSKDRHSFATIGAL